MKQHEITPLLVVSVPFLAAILGLIFTIFLYFKVKSADAGTGRQVEISATIQSGAMAFLRTEYIWLIPFVIAMAIFFLVEEAIVWADRKSVDTLMAGSTGNTPPGPMGWRIVICFIVGAILSAASGWGGMMVATECNVKTAEAAKRSLNDALKIAFAGGAVMGFVVVGLGLAGLTILFYLFALGYEDYSVTDVASYTTVMAALKANYTTSLASMAGFSFGASAIALFARVAGGIYTKAADVGADLVGKVEAGFPEDSYYNPATIADNVGDNVGDVAGMGADLFESFVGSVVAAATLAMSSHPSKVSANISDGMETFSPDLRRVALPFWVAGFGVLASMIGFFCVGTSATMEDKDQLQHSLLMALHRGIYSSAVLILIFSAVAVWMLYSGSNDLADQAFTTSGIGYNTTGYDPLDGWKDFGCLVIGLLTGILIGEATEYFTSYAHAPTRSITKSGVTGPATVIIQGLGIGMLSSVPPVIFIAAAVMSCSALSGVYGAALAAVGMLSTLGITLATDAYGPVADNAGGVAEMAHLPHEVRERTDALDALGNTTAATGKGFAVGSAVLTALAFMNAFSDRVKTSVAASLVSSDCEAATNSYAALQATAGATAAQKLAQKALVKSFCTSVVTPLEFGDFFSLANPLVLSGLLIGAMLPFLFAALTMLSVGKAATAIILEVRKQLQEKPKLKELANLSLDENWQVSEEDKDVKPDVDKVVAISTKSSLGEMLLPGALAVLTPIGVGLLVGARCLGGLLMGAIATGFLMAVMMNNAGGAWDNSKKWVENDHPEIIQGVPVMKGSDHHAAVVTGDTVGDPFKDTSGPALNILIKLMSVLSLTCASIFKNDWETWYSGVIVLVVEMLFCCVVFYFVWYKDNTMDVLTAAAGAKSAADAGETAGTSTEMKQGDASIVHNV
jgi:inorganic pyrophosphatase